MANQLEGPKFPKPIRAAAIVETAQGILLVQDLKDRFKENTHRELYIGLKRHMAKSNAENANRTVSAMRIVDNGRFSLPGGGIDTIDYITAGAESLFGLPRPPSTPEELAHFRNVIRDAAIREVSEEIGTKVDVEQVSPIIAIRGRLRLHYICILRIWGEVSIKEPEANEQREISGIGFLNEDNVIAMNRSFYQSHIQKVMDRYVHQKDRHRNIIPRYLSNLRVPKAYMDHWYQNVLLGYANRPIKYRRRNPVPEYPSSSPTFIIIGEQNAVHNPYEPQSFTDTARDKVVPQDPSRENLPSSPEPKKRPSGTMAAAVVPKESGDSDAPAEADDRED